MNPLQTTPAPTHQTPANVTQVPNPLRTFRNLTRSMQQTLWNFAHHHIHNTSDHPTPSTASINNNVTINTTPDTNATPPSTPLQQVDSLSQRSTMTTNNRNHRTYQRPLTSNRKNDPWGDHWAMNQPTNLFRVLSKNTGTINLNNLDMQAIMTELNHVHASFFAAQETNVHWDVDSLHQLVTQCQQTSPQIKIATSMSSEKASNWYKPGGTLLLALNQWTSRVTKYGADTDLRRWSYLEFVGKHDKRLIILSGYRVCNQQFNTASQTITAQQIQILQA